MHELSLLENVREIIEQYAKNQPFTSVKTVVLEVGLLSCVETEALTFAFSSVMKNSVADNAELKINLIEGIGLCEHCKQSQRIETLYEPCEKCGQHGLTVLQGLDMKIKELLVS